MEISYQLTKKQGFLIKNIESFVKQAIEPRVTETDGDEEFPLEIFKRLAENRLLRMLVPKEEDGEGAGFLDFCLVLEAMARTCPTSGLVCLTQNMGARLLSKEGTSDQKEKHLSRLMAGDAVFGYVTPALDVLSLNLDDTPVTVSVEAEGYNLNGPECQVINGDAADLIFVFAKNEDTDCCLLLEKGAPGLSVAGPKGFTGAEARCASTAVLENCSVAEAAVLGKKGKGREIMTEMLCEASVLTAALALGLGQGALNHAVQYSKQRAQFGLPIFKFQAVRIMLADMVAKMEAVRHLVYKAASVLDQKSKERYGMGGLAKYFASKMAMETATDAVQVAAGYGYMKDYPLEKMMRYAQLTQILHGSDHSHQLASLSQMIAGVGG